MFPFPRLLVLALLPLIGLLGTQIGYQYWTSSPQAQSLLSTFLPASLQDLVLFNRPRIHIRQGTIVGTTVYETLPQPVDVFKGIPYAVPPVGDRRFRRAEPVGEAEDTIDASQFGPRCVCVLDASDSANESDARGNNYSPSTETAVVARTV